MIKTRHDLAMITLAISPFAIMGPTSAQETASLDVQGKTTGTLDGDSREWVTIEGDIDGEAIT